MKVEIYEKWWIGIAALMIVSFLVTVVVAAAMHAVHPPSHVETIDPLLVRTESDFADPRVETLDDGSSLVVAVAEMFQFRPQVIRVPVGKVRFRMTSPDVIHGFQIVGTNANVTVTPGYVSEFSLDFDAPGEYLIVCNEFCGLSHHLMQGKLIVGNAEVNSSEANPMTEATRKNLLPISNFAVSIAAFGIGAVMAVMQALSRADIDVAFRSPKVYYISVTAHGVLMALVFTTFFIMGLGYVIAERTLGRLESEGMGWLSFYVAAFGSAITALVILSGKATVLYTFYPPLQAHPLFYIGATLLIVGSWIWCVVMLRTWLAWRKERRKHDSFEPLPLAMHAMLTSVIIWLLATSGLAAEVLGQLVPWSLGWIERIDPIVARTWFWWFGHP